MQMPSSPVMGQVGEGGLYGASPDPNERKSMLARWLASRRGAGVGMNLGMGRGFGGRFSPFMPPQGFNPAANAAMRYGGRENMGEGPGAGMGPIGDGPAGPGQPVMPFPIGGQEPPQYIPPPVNPFMPPRTSPVLPPGFGFGSNQGGGWGYY